MGSAKSSNTRTILYQCWTIGKKAKKECRNYLMHDGNSNFHLVRERSRMNSTGFLDNKICQISKSEYSRFSRTDFAF